MFEGLTARLGGILDGLRRRGALKEADVDAAMAEVRVALLEADVAVPVVKDFVERVGQAAKGQEVLRSVTPAQMVVKIVHDHLVETLGAEPAELNLAGNPPVALLMVGLQGSGKTTTTGKLGLRLSKRDKKKVLMASLDVYRPAAQQQLMQLGQQTGVPTLQSVLGERPLAIAERAMKKARLEGFDVVLLDTAGRLTLDDAMMTEAAEIKDAVKPAETLLVADALTAQAPANLPAASNKPAGATAIAL